MCSRAGHGGTQLNFQQREAGAGRLLSSRPASVISCRQLPQGEPVVLKLHTQHGREGPQPSPSSSLDGWWWWWGLESVFF